MLARPQKFNNDQKIPGRTRCRICYGLDRIWKFRVIFVGFRDSTEKTQRKQAHKKRPNTIPVFGPGKWLLGESRALKVGINAG